MLGSGALARAKAQTKEIIIGHQAPLTGAVAQFGKWHDRAQRAVIDRINSSGGVAGRPLRLITEDEASNPETGQDKFRKLVLQDGADFVIGSVWSATSLATAALARETKTVYFPQGIATEITGEAGNRYICKSYHSVRAAVRAGANWAVENLGKRWTIIASQLEFARSQADDWAAELQALGAEIAEVIEVPFRPADFLPFVSRVNLEKTDVLYQAFTAVDTIRFLQAAHDVGLRERLKILGLIEGIDVLDTNNPAFEGTYYITSYPRRASQIPDELKEADQIYRQAVGIDTEGYSEQGEVVPIADLFGSWQAISLIRQGIEKSGWQSKADNPAFIQALEGLSWSAGSEFPQGEGLLRAQDHLAFHGHYIERVENGQLNVLLRIPKETSLYEPAVDYTEQEF
jgi:branched-chain amino acid transport system substrate-binding protein